MVISISYYLFSSLFQKSNHTNDLPNIWFANTQSIYQNFLSDDRCNSYDEQTICLLCNEMGCNKHNPEFLIHLQPWKHLLVDSEVNLKLEEFFSFLITKYTSSWLPNVTTNEKDIELEFKELVRILASSLVLKIKNNIKLSDFILKKLTKYLMHHLEMYVHGKRTSKSARLLEESVLRQYGDLLHPSLISQQSEMQFLKSLSNLIVHTSFAPQYIKCEMTQSFLSEFISCCILSPLIDLLVDPDKINILLIYLLQSKQMEEMDKINKKSLKVEFLCNFSCFNKQRCPSYLGIKLKQILDDQHLLFLFTQFSKEKHFLNYVQFMIHMNTFFNKIINPDLNDEQLRELHENLTNIYNLYLAPNSKDYIPFEDSVFNDIEQIIKGDYVDVQQIRNSKSLYDAYEHVNDILNYYCCKFFQTDIYLKLICGQRSHNINLINKTTNKENCTNKVDYFKNSPDSTSNEDSDEICSPTFVKIKDLSNWKVSITGINSKTDSSGRENFYYDIEVIKSEPLLENKWIVERQLNEFYILESKLKEFHGDELNDITLLTKRHFSRINKTLLEHHQKDCQQFIEKLLNNTSLKCSELIHAFLTSPEMSSNSFNITKMIKNVPSKFAKERGQHLYSFLRNFIVLSERKNSLVQTEEEDAIDVTAIGSIKRNSVPKSHIDFESGSSCSDLNRINCHIEYVYDYLMLLFIRFYNINSQILQLFYIVRPLVRQTFQGFCDYFVKKKLKTNLFTSQKVVQLISNLRSSLDEQSTSDGIKFPLNLTKNQRSELALKLCKEFVPRWIVELLTDYNKHEEVVFLLFSLLQHRLLNKQLLYLLLTSFISDLYSPELYSTMEYPS